jgi:sugar/nucleoside kinase (ribokinase family)
MVADLIGGPVMEMPERARLMLVDEMGLYPGGCANNTAIALARLGLPVQLIGKVGRDPLGDFLLTALAGYGVGTQGVTRDPVAGTSATMVMIDPDGERRFIHYIGSNAGLSFEDVDLKLVENGSILHIGGCFLMPAMDGEPTARLLERAQAAGETTCLDTAWDSSGRWMQVLAPCLPHLDYFVPNLAEARAMTNLDEPGDVARALLDKGVQTVALKMGAEGCLVLTQEGQVVQAPAYQVDAVDATGAGDAFAAGFIAGIFYEWPLEKTARLANAVGAMCVSGKGAAGGVTTLDKTLEFMTTAKEF